MKPLKPMESQVLQCCCLCRALLMPMLTWTTEINGVYPIQNDVFLEHTYRVAIPTNIL